MSISNKILLKNGIDPQQTEGHLYVNIRNSMQDYAELYYKLNYPKKLDIKNNRIECPHCKFLNETFLKGDRAVRDYYLMTEVFVYLHGSDTCNLAII